MRVIEKCIQNTIPPSQKKIAADGQISEILNTARFDFFATLTESETIKLKRSPNVIQRQKDYTVVVPYVARSM